MKKLYIFHNCNEGVVCEQIEPYKFNDWFKSKTDGIKRSSHPKFVDKMPDFNSPSNEHFILLAEPIMPEPVSVITEYKLPIGPNNGINND